MERARLTAITVWSLLSLVDSEALTISVSERLINAAVGDPVLLSVRPSEKVRSGSWKHNGSDVLVWINTTANINNVYLGRVEFLQSNSSLLLKSATASDNGEYCVTMNSFGDAVVNTTIILSVFEPISSVSIISNISNTVKENDTVSLRCHVLGDWTEIVWLFNGSLVNSKGKTTFCSGNAMLMIIHVDTSNIGNYRCIVRSPVSEKASEPYSLKLNMTTTQSDSYSSHEWKAAVVVLAVISITELMGIAVLLFKVRKMSHSETQRYILPTVSGTISAPTYENFLPSVNDEDLQISNISVYEQLESRDTASKKPLPFAKQDGMP
ncbi:carcinoembryonic antigen-related cell adhesion molecule 1-like isoform X5 [Chiloscyllium plagiosum]|uniref:carcinoembryonic antigen-related cell adhesion molecule 1-like isoform X5 n=1 Tax=Chiloscyllium plagiosum TaxID=36176 RepID=UPI001CB83BFC|nr:carcinoembryonic antigen-related cell adhesion molecule 1-like isoform X5 [Chiloscyllium plagiosum]